MLAFIVALQSRLHHFDAATQLNDVCVELKRALGLILALLERADVRIYDVRQVIGLVQVLARLFDLHLELAELSVKARHVNLLNVWNLNIANAL